MLKHGCHRVVRLQTFGILPETRHQQGELLDLCGALEQIAIVKLTNCHITVVINDGEELFHIMIRFKCGTYKVNGSEREIAAGHRSLFSVAVSKDTGTASHSCTFITPTLRIIRIPLGMNVKGGVKVNEVGKETASSYLTRQKEQIIVGIAGICRYTRLELPDLDWEDRRFVVSYAVVGGFKELTNDEASFRGCICSVIDGRKNDLISSSGMDHVHVMDERFHRLMNPTNRLHSCEIQILIAKLTFIIAKGESVECGVVFTGKSFYFLHFFGPCHANIGCHHKIKCRNCLPTMHLILNTFHRDGRQNSGSLNSLCRTGCSVTITESVGKKFVQGMLNTRQRFSRKVILVVYMKHIHLNRFTGFFRQQIIVNKRLGRLSRKLHHHAGGSICIHIGVVTRYIIGLCLNDLLKNRRLFSATHFIAHITINNKFLGSILTLACHQLVLDDILNGLNMKIVRSVLNCICNS